MKITTEGILAANQVQKSTQQEKVSRPFDEILTDMENKETAAANRTSPSQPAFQIPPVFLDNMHTGDVLEGLDASLSLLESYQLRLGDSSVPVHELRSDIDRLQDETNLLQSRLDKLPDNDPVRNLLNRSIVTMTVEIEKYRRGDFQ